jgi:hypothetical protein
MIDIYARTFMIATRMDVPEAPAPRRRRGWLKRLVRRELPNPAGCEGLIYSPPPRLCT